MTETPVDKLLKSLLPAGRSAAEEFRIQIQRLVNSYRDLSSFNQVVDDVQARAYRLEPLIAEEVRRSQLAAWTRAAKDVVQPLDLPPANLPPRLPTSNWPVLRGDDLPPTSKLPKIEAAADYLRTRIDFTPEEFEQLDADAKQVGFTVARVASTDAVAAVRKALFEDITEGGTLAEFRRNVSEALDGSSLSEPQVEAIYRTHVARAYSAGQKRVLGAKLVSDEFPYVLYSATHDSRVRPDHLAMESLGLNGTAVYRADDPIWDHFYPPWAWNCRCTAIPLSIEDAAEYGVQEAIDWRDSGVAPQFPQWVPSPPFKLPKGWVPISGRLHSVM